VQLDAAKAPPGTSLRADVCIIGAGPVGLALARELATNSGRQVLVLESGGYAADPRVQELSAGETTGDPYEDLRWCRYRGVGGTTAIWNTWFEGTRSAKYLPLDPIDFEPREWIPWSGWPFGRELLDRYYARANTLCGGGPFDFEASSWNIGEHHLLTFPPDALSNYSYQYGPSERFTATLPAELGAATSVMLAHGATVTELLLSASGDRVSGLRWATLSGGSGTAEASCYVLATGGIENARILLLTLGERPWLGRGFMEHPVDTSMVLSSRHPALLDATGFYSHRQTEFSTPVLGRIGLLPSLQRSERLRNASIRLLQDVEPQVLQSTQLRPAARRLIPFPAVRRLLGSAIRGTARLTRPLRSARWQLVVDLEQGPHPDNRVVLSDRRDHFGRPRAVLHYRFREADQLNRSRLCAVVTRELERAGAGRVSRDPAQPIDCKHHHHAGTTRMHPDPNLGVVDEQLRVHGMENLFLSGSSVFPTAGFANPTLTALALTLRLADHLSSLP
jgi:choline dehydrogenase-like flavoprotein